MSVRSWPRLIAATALGLLLACLLAAQALSSVSLRKAPELSVRLFPANGAAREQHAFSIFVSGVSAPGDEPEAARSAAAEALEAVKREPLAPKAYAILALASPDGASRRAILDGAHKLNRRDPTLQGLVLQERLADQDYPGTIETLDQLLRVNPELSRDFFPVLASALAEEETLPLFAQMLDGSASWHEGFLAHAVRQRAILQNLAQLRAEIAIADENFDRQLIAGLAAVGNIDSARQLVQRVSGSAKAADTKGSIDWRSTYPPFEWQLSDEAGFRAQASNDMKRLELAVRPGKGGVIAARLLKAPVGPFAVRVKHRIAPADQLRDVRLQLICADDAQTFLDERLSRQGDAFEISAVPSGCSNVLLAINARAWSGRSALSGTIDQIEIVRR